MSDFKKGDRVEHLDGRRGVAIDDQDEKIVPWRLDRGGVCISHYRDLTKIADATPLRFEDVRTGDLITVETEDFKITGRAADTHTSGRVEIAGTGIQFYQSLDGTWCNVERGTSATLTAHEPDEAWKRARVIKAQQVQGSAQSNHHFLLRCEEEWVDRFGDTWRAESLRDVTVVVDENGEVVS